jgi:YgiT-type zinc finger domain-containing protein
MPCLSMRRRNLTMTISPSSISKTLSSRARSSSASATGKRAKSNISSEATHSAVSSPKRSSKLPRTELSSSSRSIAPKLRCAACGRRGVQQREVTRSYGRGTSLLVIEGIPLWSCPNCGESYFTAQTLHEIERIKTLRKAVAVERRVQVAAFRELSA